MFPARLTMHTAPWRPSANQNNCALSCWRPLSNVLPPYIRAATWRHNSRAARFTSRLTPAKTEGDRGSGIERQNMASRCLNRIDPSNHCFDTPHCLHRRAKRRYLTNACRPMLRMEDGTTLRRPSSWPESVAPRPHNTTTAPPPSTCATEIQHRWQYHQDGHEYHRSK